MLIFVENRERQRLNRLQEAVVSIGDHLPVLGSIEEYRRAYSEDKATKDLIDKMRTSKKRIWVCWNKNKSGSENAAFLLADIFQKMEKDVFWAINHTSVKSLDKDSQKSTTPNTHQRKNRWDKKE